MPNGKMPYDPEGEIRDVVACPKCGAEPGEGCQTAQAKSHGFSVHTARTKAVNAQPDAEPTAEDPKGLEAVEDGHNAINFDGWKVYPTTGRPYRRWTFERDVPGVGASEGDRPP